MERYIQGTTTSPKSPLVTNNIGNVPGKKGLLFAEGAGHKVRRGLTFSHTQIKGLLHGF